MIRSKDAETAFDKIQHPFMIKKKNKTVNVHIIWVPEGEESYQGGKKKKKLFEEIMSENFPNLVKEKVTQVQ